MAPIPKVKNANHVLVVPKFIFKDPDKAASGPPEIIKTWSFKKEENGDQSPDGPIHLECFDTVYPDFTDVDVSHEHNTKTKKREFKVLVHGRDLDGDSVREPLHMYFSTDEDGGKQVLEKFHLHMTAANKSYVLEAKDLKGDLEIAPEMALNEYVGTIDARGATGRKRTLTELFEEQKLPKPDVRFIVAPKTKDGLKAWAPKK